MNGRFNEYSQPNQSGRGPVSDRVHRANELTEEIRQAVPIFLDPNRDPHGKKLVDCAEKLGEYLKHKNMTTSQIRNLFIAAKRIKYSSPTGPYEKNLLRAKFAYNAGRFSQIKDFQKIADKALEFINTEEHFKRFVNFFEAVVAYHKAYGGKE